MDAAYRGSSEGEGLSEAELQQRDLGFFFFLLMRTLGRYSQPTFAICQTARSFDFFAAPYISLHLPTSPHISLHLPTSPYISQARSFDFFAALYISLHLPTSPYISPHLPTSPRRAPSTSSPPTRGASRSFVATARSTRCSSQG